jgi:hypothetical protein
MFLRNLNAPTYTYYDDYESETTVGVKPTVGGKPTVTTIKCPLMQTTRGPLGLRSQGARL